MASTIEKLETPEKPVDIKKGMSPEAFAWHIAGLIIFGGLILFLTWWNFSPMFTAPAASLDRQEIPIPQLDTSEFRGFPCLHGGRHKPLESAAKESVRLVVGRERVHKKDPTAVVVMWMLEKNPKAFKPKSEWDDIPFILCENHDLRRLIFGLNKDGSMKKGDEAPTHDQVHGKYITPNQARDFIERAKHLNTTRPDRFAEITRPLDQEMGELQGRLRSFENLSKIPEPGQTKSMDPFAFVALDEIPASPWFSIGDLRIIAGNEEGWYEQMKARVKKTPQSYINNVPEHRDALVAFQKEVKNGNGEEAISELSSQLSARRSRIIGEYVELQKKIKKLSAQRDNLKPDGKENTAKVIAQKKIRLDEEIGDKKQKAAELLAHEVMTWPLEAEITTDDGKKKVNKAEESKARLRYHLRAMFRDDPGFEGMADRYLQEPRREKLYLMFYHLSRDLGEIESPFRRFLKERDQKRIDDLLERLPSPGDYDPESQKFRMLHLNFMETRFPDLYETAIRKSQSRSFAEINKDIKAVLASYDALGEAYRVTIGKDELTPEMVKEFNSKREDFFQTVAEVSSKVNPYPGEDTVGDRIGSLMTLRGDVHPPSQELLNLEMTFNSVRPFMWSWIIMLVSVLFFCLSLGLNSRICHILGFSAFAVSLVFQCFGFVTRILISGRAPVSNMYETVIWVAFMSSIFALILEAIYRRKVIALAGALVATIGLVLADALPLALDPKISPLTPVLRSNFWLTIHVLTIVSSYAAGTLAWGLGNISLIMIVFGSTNKLTIRMLSNFTYRALQIAVLLLATGTFLGGWWAAYSWGRFWGWDPKEVGALVALLAYVIPLHMRYLGWIKDFGLAVSGILCYAFILLSWYGINFFMPGGLHSYGFGGGGEGWVFWTMCLNIEWVIAASLMYRFRVMNPAV